MKVVIQRAIERLREQALREAVAEQFTPYIELICEGEARAFRERRSWFGGQDNGKADSRNP